MAQGIQDWSTTAGSNGTADAGINWAEGQTPASVNNSARAMMAALRAFYNALGGGISYGGSSSAYTATNSSPGTWTAYAEGQIIGLEANHTNTGASTINVDALGAKSIVKGASTALIAGDITSGCFYLLRYDGTNFQIITGAGAGAAQPLDATLTALAALSWSSGSPLVSFTAADTVSLTLAPSVSSVTAQNGSAAGTPAASFVNTTDAASVQAIRIEGDRATPAINDEVYASFLLSDASGNQSEFGRITALGATLTNNAEVGQFRFGVANAGAIANLMLMNSTRLGPITNDGLALGVAGTAWSDLFLASGALVGFGNGAVTLTHDATLDGLVVAGGSFVSRLGLSTETTGTLTAVSANKKILATGGITLPNSVFAAEDTILIDGNGTARTITRGSGVTMYVAGVDSATATLAANGLMGVSWRTASVCLLSGAVS